MRQYLLTFWLFIVGSVVLLAESEVVDPAQVAEAPYIFAGRLFSGSSENGSKQSGSGVAIGPGIVLTAAHVYWTEAWGSDDSELPAGASPWLAYRKWYPAASSPLSEGFENVASVVSLAGYDDALHEYDTNRNDATSPFEAFNRDSLLLIFSDDTPTPYGYMRPHPRAAETGFLGEKNFYEVIGYPSAKYSGSDSRKWQVHATTEKDPFVVSKIPSLVYDAGYSDDNRLYTGGESLDSYAGNSGGPVIARTHADEPWLVVGVYVGSNALFRGMDQELASLIDTAVSAQIEPTDSRFRFVEGDLSFSEGAGSVQVAVERLGDVSEAAVADVQVVDFEADQQEDFSYDIKLDWPAGESGIKEFTLQIVDDELREGRETLLLLLESQTNGILDFPNSALVTIEDNDLNGPLDQWMIVDEVGAVDYSEVVFAEGKFVSVGGINTISWSPDYQDLSVQEFEGLNRLYQLTYANGLFLASGDGPQMLVSEDAETWEIVELPTSVSLFSTQYGLGWYVAVGGIDAGDFSQGEIWVSRDTRTWINTYDEKHDRFDDVEFGNGRFVARAGEDIYISTDARNWAGVETTGLSGIPSDIEFGAGVFVNAGRLGGIYISEDGISWTLVRQEDEESFYGVGFRNGYFVATGISGKLSTSSDGGQTWIDRIPDTQEHLWHGVTAAGKMVVIGDNGLLMTSDLPEYFDFIHEPVSQFVQTGDSVNFFAEFLSSKNGPYTLQWQKDGEDLMDETSPTLSISNVAAEDFGEYQLIVSGDGTKYTSAVATLAIEVLVNPPENVSASTTTSRGVRISWDDTSSGETNYRIERRMLGFETWEVVMNLSENATRFIDRSLVPDTEYEYRVITVFQDGEMAQDSNSVRTLTATNLVNLSTRGLVGKGDDVMIGGFTIPEGPEMTVYIRGLGPSLQSSGISNAIGNPQLRLVRASTGTPFEITNDDWIDAENVEAILATELPPDDDREAAILVTLPAGGYTIILSSENEETMSVGMIEIYDITDDCEDCRLINLSTRGPVSAGNDLMIGGIVIAGMAKKEVYVRALGPSLTSIAAPLQDPFLKMIPGNGQAVSIDNWTDSANAEVIADLGLPFADSHEVGELFQLGAGTYTFQITGVNNTSGVALLELFELE